MRAQRWMLVACLLGAGCGDDDAPPPNDDAESRAAEALARAMHFSGGELRDGAMGLATEERVEVLLESEQVVEPGGAGIMALGVDNPIADDNAEVAVLLQFGDVDQHVRVPKKNSVDGPGDLNLQFDLDDDVCEGLCADVIDVDATIALELDDGAISKHLRSALSVDCREKGSPDACDDGEGPSKPRRDGGVPGLGGDEPAMQADGGVPVGQGATGRAVTELLDTLEEVDSELCACLPGTASDECLSQVGVARACMKAVLSAESAANSELLVCARGFFVDQLDCVTAAACDEAGIGDCTPANDAELWAALGEQCGTIPATLRVGIDACGQGASCPDGASLPLDAICDGTEDCSDGSDEVGCDLPDPPDPGEKPTSFPCPSSSTLIDIDLVCDGAQDCTDGFDEMVCIPCESGGGQYSVYDRCDGADDCSDGTDEATCSFPCTNGEMIPITDLCDGTPDCSDGTDESFCNGNAFTCANGDTVPIAQVCDGTDDCSDGSDENPSLCGSMP